MTLVTKKNQINAHLKHMDNSRESEKHKKINKKEHYE